jgi:hypothetical protein
MDRHSDVFTEAHRISEEPGVVELTESAKVLDLLLSILYRLDGAKSKLKSADRDSLKAVAEAAEKYLFDMISGICEKCVCGMPYFETTQRNWISAQSAP